GAIVRQSLDEGAVDLQRIDRQARQERERGVPGPEVVDRDTHPRLAKPLEPAAARLEVLKQGGLGDLHLDAPGLAEHSREQLQRLLDESAAPQLKGGHIDADPYWTDAGGAPAPAGLNRLLEHPAADRHDEPGRF